MPLVHSCKIDNSCTFHRFCRYLGYATHVSEITFRQLQHFVAAAAEGSVTAGAVRAHVSQSTMSSSLSALEKSLGASIFQRYKRGVSLTPAGRALLIKTKRILADIEDLHATAQELDNSLQGSLVVGCYTTLAPSLMPEVITSFLQAYPKIDLRFMEGSDEQLATALRDGQCEVILTYDYRLERFLPYSELRREEILSSAPYAILPAKHDLANKDEVELAELVQENLVLLDLPPAGEYFLQIFDKAGLDPKVRFRTTSHQLVFSLVERGLGYSILTQFSSSGPGLVDNNLAVRKIANDLPPLPIVALSMAGVRMTQRAKIFTSHIQRSLSG